MKITPDSKYRIVLKKDLREALDLKRGDSLEMYISSGAVFLTPTSLSDGKVISKGKIKVYAGKIPTINVEEAVSKTRGPRV